MADQVPRGRGAELPAGGGGQFGGGIVKSPGCDVRNAAVQLLTPAEGSADIANETVLVGIGAQSISAPNVRFPGFEDRTEIEKHHVVRLDPAILAFLVVAEQGVRTRA